MDSSGPRSVQCGGESPVYFYGHAEGKRYREFSQFYPAPFESSGVVYQWNEQYMMARKAQLMGDDATKQLILAASKPGECKALGRSVTPWDQKKWDMHKYDIVVEATKLKVLQNEHVMDVLLSTGKRVLAEASPSDRIWGIGISVADAEKGRAWRGQNLLGKALMRVRENVQASEKNDR